MKEKSTLEYLLLQQLVHTKTTLALLRPTKCLCDPTMRNFCDRCLADKELDAIEVLIKKVKLERKK